MSSSAASTVERYGLTEVYTCDNPTADVIFVHGLNGDPERTWTSQGTHKFWPRDLLPKDLDGRARVLVYGYDADVVAWGGNGGVGKDMIHNHAERLVATLVANRRRQHAEERPIIFVAHSLGGLVVKRALIYSSEIRVGTRTERLRSVFLSTYGILFLGTPHHGSDVAYWGSYLEKIAGVVLPKRFVDSAPQLVEALKSNSETLVNIDRGFSSIMSLFHLYFFHEAKKTDMKGTLQFIVEEDSAAPTLPDVERASIPADHSHMCKFDSERSPGYDLVTDAISFYVEEAEESHAVVTRWRQERQVRRIGQGGNLLTEGYGSPQPEISEPSSRGSSPAPDNRTKLLLPPSASSSIQLPQSLDTQVNSDLYFFVPPGFRPNSHFVGMKKQLVDLDERLFDIQARQTGTAAVVLHGPAGSGKSHLARQYLYRHRSRFKGGIFWINARIKDEMHRDLWQIAQKFVARDSPSTRIDPSGNGREYVSAVREWFSNRSEWLIIVDGVALDNRVQAEEIQKMIPDSRNSSLIYTSRSSQLYASQRLLHPHPIRIPKLSNDEGQDLMFKELNIKRTESNKKAAIELVKTVGGLPLAIHAMSVRLAETHEPLEKYSPKSYANDPRLGVPYHEILAGLWHEHPAAYNLMNVLAFFGPHIPVELIILGLKALRTEDQVVEVRSQASPYEPADLNTSFSILMRNALVERNEPGDTDSAASSRSSLLEPEPIDVLRLHGVVQRFCRDRLNSQKELSPWLKLAWKVCLRSYHGAKERMDERAKEGDTPRVSDFREYLIHAQRMRDFTLEYEQRNQGLGELRNEVDQLISEIKDEIAQREPTSSQESVIRNYAVSIFDRTSSTSSTDSAPITPGFQQVPQALQLEHQTPWGTDMNQTPLISPVEFRSGSAVESRPAAIDMLRRFSGNTVRGEPVVLEDGEAIKQPRHFRTGSRPAFEGGTFTITPGLGINAQIDSGHATGAMAGTTMTREGNMSGSSQAVSGLTEIYRNSPPPARGGAFVSSRRPTPPAQSAFARPPEEHSIDRPSLARHITRRSAAGPKLSYILNPTAPEFTPSSWPGYTSYEPMYDSTNLSEWYMVNQNGHGSSEDQVLFQGQVPVRQIRSSIGNASIDANLHASKQPVYIDPAFYQMHHGRASSVPEIPIYQNEYWTGEQFSQPAFAVSGPLSPPSINMTRDNSSHSRSSGSGMTAFRPPSNPPQFTSPFAVPSQHPLAQVSSPSPSATSPYGLFRGSSPLANVQTPGGSVSPVTIAQVSQHPSPPPPALGPNGRMVHVPAATSGAQSAPATTVFPAPPHGTNMALYSPSPLPFAPSPVHLPTSAHPSASPFMAENMSRSSSGPGIVFSTPGYGLGIAEFGAPAAIRFGQQEPVDIAEAQRRAESQQRHLDQERQRLVEAQRRAAAYRGGVAGRPGFGVQSEILPSVTQAVWGLQPTIIRSIPPLPTAHSNPAVAPPYPDVNLIPTDSDKQMLQAMVNEGAIGPHPVPAQQAQPQFTSPPGVSRSRRFSEPYGDGVSGPPNQ